MSFQIHEVMYLMFVLSVNHLFLNVYSIPDDDILFVVANLH
jgi:hypothetical protein